MLQEGEQERGKWTTNLLVEGNRMLGELVITDAHIYFKSQYHISLESVVRMGAFKQYGNDAEQMLCIPRKSVSRITAEEKMLKKKILLETTAGNLVIDNGMMSVKAMMQALEPEGLSVERR